MEDGEEFMGADRGEEGFLLRSNLSIAVHPLESKLCDLERVLL
jgi:hypothetical protein